MISPTFLTKVKKVSELAEALANHKALFIKKTYPDRDAASRISQVNIEMFHEISHGFIQEACKVLLAVPGLIEALEFYSAATKMHESDARSSQFLWKNEWIRIDDKKAAEALAEFYKETKE